MSEMQTKETNLNSDIGQAKDLWIQGRIRYWR